MKLKERPLEWWKGKKYTYWCRADINDERKINYTLIHRSIGQGERIFRFTSEDDFDTCSDEWYWVTTALIKELKLIGNEWHVTLIAGIVLKEDFA